MSLFSWTVKENQVEGNNIACEDYPTGYVRYAFDLSPHLVEGHFNLVKQGTIRVELKFGKALVNTVTVVTVLTPILRTSSKSTAIET